MFSGAPREDAHKDCCGNQRHGVQQGKCMMHLVPVAVIVGSGPVVILHLLTPKRSMRGKKRGKKKTHTDLQNKKQAELCVNPDRSGSSWAPCHTGAGRRLHC